LYYELLGNISREGGIVQAYVVRIMDAANDAKTVICRIPEDQPELNFIPGQYAAFRFISAPGSLNNKYRCFSFSRPLGDPRQFQFTVRAMPNGGVSAWIFNHLAAGDPIEFTRPRGKFAADPKARRLLMFAGGSGITPIRCIIENRLKETDSDIALFYASRDSASMIFIEDIKALAEQFPDRFTVRYHFYKQLGFPSMQDLQSMYRDFPADQVLCCGPKKFMPMVAEARLAACDPVEAITCEDYSGTGVAKQKQDSFEESEVRIRFTLNDQCETIQTNNTQTILESIRLAGFNPPHDCEQGFCGTCVARLECGEVHPSSRDGLSDEEIVAGCILTCQSFAKTHNIVLDYNTETVANPVGATPHQPGAGIKKAGIAATGLLLAGIPVFSAWFLPTHLNILHPGPMTPGHETLSCAACHTDAKGSLRQQLQGKINFWSGKRKTEPDIFLSAVNSDDCLACHKRPNDRHPINRFREPRFVDALQVTDARTCLSCHTEHTGRRVIGKGEFCMACHKDLVVKKDPLDISHVRLIKKKMWSSCLGCHDFHKNHKRKTQTTLATRIPAKEVMQYFIAGPDPYAAKKMFVAKKERK